MIVKRRTNDKATECMVAAPPAGAGKPKKESSPEYQAAINATVYQLVTLALARAMVRGIRTSAVRGSVYGTYRTYAGALAARERDCKRFAPAGKNLETGKQEAMKVYTAVIVATTGGLSEILT